MSWKANDKCKTNRQNFIHRLMVVKIYCTYLHC